MFFDCFYLVIGIVIYWSFWYFYRMEILIKSKFFDDCLDI